MRIIEQHKLPYESHDYSQSGAISGMEVVEALGQEPGRMFKTLVTQGASKNYYVFMVPANGELHLKKAAKAVGEKSVELLHVKDIRAVTGYIRGGCTPIGMKKQYPTVLHSSALQFDEIILSGGCLGAQIFLAPADLVKVTGAKVTDLLMENGE